MDFLGWGEYLNEKTNINRDTQIEKEFEEFNAEFSDLEPEEENYKISIPEGHILFLKHESDSFIDGVKKSLSSISKSGKLETLLET